MCLCFLLLHNPLVFFSVALAQIREGMAENQPSGDAVESISTVTGGSKPLHRFLRGEPKSIGIVLVFIGICLCMFGIPMKTELITSASSYSPFWLGILFTICGLLYILSERNPTKKIITASFALSIVTTIGLISACTDFVKAMMDIQHRIFHEKQNLREEKQYYYMPLCIMEQVFLVHSLIGGVLLVTMMVFSRAALRSSRTQVVVVMKNLLTVVE